GRPLQVLRFRPPDRSACEPPLDRGVYDRVRALGHVRPVPSGDRLVDELETIGVIVDGPAFASHGNDTAGANLHTAPPLPGREPLHTIPNVHRSSGLFRPFLVALSDTQQVVDSPSDLLFGDLRGDASIAVVSAATDVGGEAP